MFQNRASSRPTGRPQRPTPLAPNLVSPSEPELWAIEAGADVLAAELALVDAECAWYARPGPGTAADFVEALLVVVDRHGVHADRLVGVVA